MFLVRVEFEHDGNYEETDKKLFEAAGKISGGSGSTLQPPFIRDHSWREETFQSAQQLKARLDAVPGIKATIREI